MRDSWVEYKFKDVATATKGKLPKNKNEVGVGIPYLTANFLRNNKADFWIENLEGAVIAQEGDCLILWDGAGAGDLFTAKSGVVSSTMAVVTTKSSDVLREFLTLFVSSKANYIKETCRGTTVPHVSPDAISNMELAIPPLPEQKRIVDLISSVDSFIEALQLLLKNAKISRNAVLHELLTVGGEDWIETSLGEVADVIDPHPSHRAPAVDEDGIPFIGIGDLRKTGDIDFAKARRVSKEILEEHKARYDRSQYLIGLGRVASIGMVVRLPNERIDYAVSPTLAVIKAKDVEGQFLFYLLEGPNSQEQFQKFKKGSTRESVGMQILRQIRVNVPPRSEQKRIVEIISSMDKVVDQTQEAIGKAMNLRSGLLSDLLSGDHEIPFSYDKVIGAA
jgi:type I restriction enzyme S subunit